MVILFFYLFFFGWIGVENVGKYLKVEDDEKSDVSEANHNMNAWKRSGNLSGTII